MALEQFWAEVATRNPLFRDWTSAQEPFHITEETLLAKLTESNNWHFAGPLRGYADADFDFFPEDKRKELSQLVGQYNELATKLKTLVHRKRSSVGELEEAEVANHARPLLVRIILLLEQDRYFSGESLRLGQLVERELMGQLPDEEVTELRFFVGPDWSNDPAFFALAFVVEEATATEEKLRVFSRRVRPLITDAMYRVAPGHFCYLSFRFLGDEVLEEEEIAV